MTTENKQIIFLAGYSAAGKSTLARELRDNHGYQFVEHQPLVHEIARSKGYERARHWLADVGVEQFASESAKAMVVKTQTELNKGETKIVFDVAYGLKMIELFRNEFPDIFRLIVFVMSDANTRTRNIQKRMGTGSISEAETELRFRDDFLRTVGVDEVIQQSDIRIINKNRQIKEVASELIEQIREHIKTND